VEEFSDLDPELDSPSGDDDEYFNRGSEPRPEVVRCDMAPKSLSISRFIAPISLSISLMDELESITDDPRVEDEDKAEG